MKKIFTICLLNVFNCLGQNTAILSGSTFRERSDALINQTSIQQFNANTIDTRTGFVYCAARYLRNTDIAYADAQLNILLDRCLTGDAYMQFSTYAVMHTYFLCKNQLNSNLKNKIKSYMQSINFNFRSGGTYNLTLMPHIAVYLACEEWPDFLDASGRSHLQIKAYSKIIVDTCIDNAFLTHNHEFDSPTYYPTNIAPFRLLSDFSKDIDLQQRAFSTFQMCIAHMNGCYNNGLYIANPLRSKGWGNLGDGLKNASGLNSYAWLLFGKGSDQFYYQSFAESKGFEYFNFWLAYPGYSQPLPSIFQSNNSKTYPNFKLGHLFKRTYQSANYGMATWDTPSGNPNTSYNWKESKRHYLAWQSDTLVCHFTVCQDNPRRPIEPTIANAFGYGNNPYHRIMQHQGTAIGIWNIPTIYFFYKLYLPFEKTSYKGLLEKHGWIICHTGSMMFAIKTLEPYSWDIPSASLYQIARVDSRKGSWIMETTELGSLWGTGTINQQMNNYADALNQNTVITTGNYTTATPQLQYTALDGNILNITFFNPEQTYTNQFKVNGISYLPSTKINEGITAEQNYNTNSIEIKSNGIVIDQIVHGQDAQNSIVINNISQSGIMKFNTNVSSQKYYWIFPEGTQFLNNTNAFSDSPNVQFNSTTLSQAKFNIFVFTDRGRSQMEILGAQSTIATEGMVRFNTDNYEFEGFDGVEWKVLGGSNNVLDKLNANASVAYSMRKLRAAYTGTAVRVRRSFDNTEQNIGFTTSGDLNLSALQSFVGSGDGFVTTWYDQSGNGRNATQLTETRQAKIVNAGIVVLLNGKPAIETAIQGQAYSLSLSLSSVSNLTASFVGARTGNLSAGIASFILGTGPIGSTGTLNKFLFAAPQTANFGIYGQSSLSTAASLTKPYGQNTICAFRHTTSNTGISYINGYASPETAAGFVASGYDATTLTILNYGSATQTRGIIGKTQEIIVFSNDIGVMNLDILTKNQSSIYGVTLY